MAPPAPAAASPRPNTRAATDVTLIPTSCAEAGLAAAARIARPSQVLVRISQRPPSTTTARMPPYTWALGRKTPPTWNDSSTYDGRIEVELLPQISPITPSVTSARPKVSSTVDDIGAERIGRTSSR